MQKVFATALLASIVMVGAVTAPLAHTGLIKQPIKNYDTACMLHAGCIWQQGTGTWYCPDPGTYSLCFGGP